MKIQSTAIFKGLRKWFLRKTSSSGVRRIPSIFSALASDIGVGRDDNQDRTAIVRFYDYRGDPYTLVLISDGMGGMKDGGICAATTMAAFLASFLTRSKLDGKVSDWLIRAALDANKIVFDEYQGRGGATLSALYLNQEGSGGIVHVGDTRVYGFDGDSVIQLTTDDTIAGQLGNKVDSLKNRNELLQFIGMGQDLDPHYLGFVPSGLRMFLLTTDGVHFLDKGVVKDLVVNSEDVGACVKRLVEVAKWCGSKDNCSAVAVSIDPSAFFGLGDADTGLCEVWDSFGDLQVVVMPAASVELKGTKPYAIEKNAGLRKWLKSSEKSTPKNRENLSDRRVDSLISENDVGDVADITVPLKKTDDESAKSKDKKEPQLKISFPSKE
jgi:serine/threonine protein phosphatase PrpC